MIISTRLKRKALESYCWYYYVWCCIGGTTTTSRIKGVSSFMMHPTPSYFSIIRPTNYHHFANRLCKSFSTSTAIYDSNDENDSTISVLTDITANDDNDHDDNSVDSNIPKQLFPYQELGVEQLIAKKRLLLADQMGLGKTIQCIEAINQLSSLENPKKSSLNILIISPKSVLGVWKSELESWLHPTIYENTNIQIVNMKDEPELTLLDSTKTNNNKNFITLINYDICYKLKETLQSIKYDILICDEAHYLKSVDAKRTNAILGDVMKKKKKSPNNNNKDKKPTTNTKKKTKTTESVVVVEGYNQNIYGY